MRPGYVNVVVGRTHALVGIDGHQQDDYQAIAPDKGPCHVINHPADKKVHNEGAEFEMRAVGHGSNLGSQFA